MTINRAEYVAILRAGIDAEDLREDNTFATACYNDNTVADLLAALKMRSADRDDCAAWKITPSQWRASICAALAAMAYDYESKHGLNGH